MRSQFLTRGLAASLVVVGSVITAVAPAPPALALATAPSIPQGRRAIRNRTFLTFKLTDRLEAKINVGSGTCCCAAPT